MNRIVLGVGAALAIAAAALLIARLPASSDRGARSAEPNVVIFLTDDQRKRGGMATMPKTRRIFGRGGTRFAKAFATTPQCCPSRASIFSGQYVHNHGITDNKHSFERFDRDDNWQRHLQDAGYRTGFFGKLFNDWPASRGPAPHFDESLISSADPVPPRGDRELGVEAARFIAESETSDEPWALLLSFKSPHAPFVAERRYRRADVGSLAPTPGMRDPGLSGKHPRLDRAQGSSPEAGGASSRRSPLKMTPAQIRRAQLRMVMTVDDVVDDVWRRIESLGAAENTLAFFLSDHGFYWGEHGLRGKFFPYLDSVRIPMLMRWDARGLAGEADPRFALNIDVAPTIYDAVGIDPSAEGGYVPDGRSLLDRSWERDWVLLEGPSDTSYEGWPRWRNAYLDDRDLFIAWEDGFAEHYDLRSDPDQLDNTLGPGTSPAKRRRVESRFVPLLDGASDCRGPDECP